MGLWSSTSTSKKAETRKAQTRLCQRYRKLSALGKKPTVGVAAIARELSGFIWAIGKEVKLTPI